MNDQEEPMALNDESEVNAPVTTPVTQTNTTGDESQPDTNAEPTGEADTQGPETETVDSSKKGYTQRVRELNARAKAAEAKAESLAEKLAKLTGSVEPETLQVPQYQPQEPIVKPGEEIDLIELDRRIQEREKRILQQAQAFTTLRGEQEKAINRINTEASEAIKAYPELDPDSETFNQELSDAVTKAVEAHIRANPYKASVKTFVKDMIAPYRKAVAKEVGQAQETLAKQASQTALRPTQVRTVEKAASEMDIAELEKKLGIVQS